MVNSTDLAPVGPLLLLALLLALVPMFWVLRRHAGAQGRYRALAMLTLFLCFDLVLFGAFTRLSDSGLGCPDWPGCYGQSNPLEAHGHIAAAQDAMPTGPVTHGKAWIEMLHRYLAGTVGALITALLGFHLWLRRHARATHAASWWPAITLVWVCVQGAFGAFTVTMKLFPLIVTLHLLGGLVLLALLALQARALPALDAGGPSAALRPGLWLLLILVFTQAALGAWVSSNYAVLACDSFPLCQGTVWPAMDFAQGFGLWRALGHSVDGGILSFQALTAIHMAHRLFAFVVLAALVWQALRLHAGGETRLARWLRLLALAQLLSGLGNVVLGWPLAAALAHTGGAAALVLVLVSALASKEPA